MISSGNVAPDRNSIKFKNKELIAAAAWVLFAKEVRNKANGKKVRMLMSNDSRVLQIKAGRVKS